MCTVTTRELVFLFLRSGVTENARTEDAAPSKMQGWKTRDWKTRHQCVGVENTGPNATERRKYNNEQNCKVRSTRNTNTQSYTTTSMNVIIESMSRQKICGWKKYIRQQCEVLDTSAGLTIVPLMPSQPPPPLSGAPAATCYFFSIT